MIVITYDLPDMAINITKWISVDPSNAIYSLECFLADFFSSIFYTRMLVELILPYVLLFLVNSV